MREPTRRPSDHFPKRRPTMTTEPTSSQHRLPSSALHSRVRLRAQQTRERCNYRKEGPSRGITTTPPPPGISRRASDHPVDLPPFRLPDGLEHMRVDQSVLLHRRLGLCRFFGVSGLPEQPVPPRIEEAVDDELEPGCKRVCCQRESRDVGRRVDQSPSSRISRKDTDRSDRSDLPGSSIIALNSSLDTHATSEHSFGFTAKSTFAVIKRM